MQTFLPYADFLASARALDQKRLGKQRVETVQVLRGLITPGYGWRHHPAVKMWRGYEEGLIRYGLDVAGVWTATGRADTTVATLLADWGQGTEIRTREALAEAGELPPWLGEAEVHRSHQSALLRKDPDFYRPLFGPDVPDDLPYVWPVSDRPGRDL
ncbi:MSMEG_6728 family protein [Actinoplanes sp. M2I2]|uniref:MSMEG_6728 family protein n=1 Tax=Actinoplanes sp. M2I2 TaxID=1734444 RepID=UPI00201FF8A9|nr:MSMEG_6728 family protein [Actinoplanes sp. M2I2]